MGDIAQRGNKLTKGQAGHGPIPYLNKPGQAQGTHGGKAKGGVVRRPRKPSTHGKDVPTMAAKGGRIGLKHGGKPWGDKPKPGTHEYMMQDIHKRKGKAAGGAMSGARRAVKTFIERAGGSEKGKPHSTKEGRIASGKRKISRFLQSRALKPKPGPKAPSGPKKTWPPKYSDLLKRYPKMPQPHKSPGDTPYIPKPKYTPGEPKIMQPAAKGGRAGPRERRARPRAGRSKSPAGRRSWAQQKK